MKNKMSVFVLICKSVNFLEISVSGQEIEVLSFSMYCIYFASKISKCTISHLDCLCPAFVIKCSNAIGAEIRS